VQRHLDSSKNFRVTPDRWKVSRCGFFFFSNLRSPENIDCADTRVDTRHLDTFGYSVSSCPCAPRIPRNPTSLPPSGRVHLWLVPRRWINVPFLGRSHFYPATRLPSSLEPYVLVTLSLSLSLSFVPRRSPPSS